MLTKLKTIYFSRQVIESLIFSFLSIILALYGFDDYQVGRLLALAPITMLVAMPLFTLIDDGGKRQKIILVICLILTTALSLLFLIPKITFWGMALLIIALAVVRAPLAPSIDGFTTIIAQNKGSSFSRVRIWASICYIFFMAAGGFLIDYIGFGNVVIISCAFMALTTVLVITVPMPDIEKPTDNKGATSFKQLFSNKSFILFLVSVVLTWTVWSASYNYDGSYYADRWGQATEFGLIEGMRVIFEVLAIIVINRLAKKPSMQTVFAFFGLTTAIKYLLHFFNAPLWSLYALAPFIGVGFGGVLAVYVDFITANIKKHNIHIALFVLECARMAFSALYTYLVSFVAEQISLRYVYLIFCVLAVLGTVFSAFLFKTKSNQISA